ncbi:16S rRNA (adenine(1518)-N(6)/adenine(1519)-N(6))-dimethyltransferase RsmA [Ureaplasma miroungigenitalium]|uniref:Ribosomal RNA small subunit methyltransferase A n=1 Tax=Ureaplasma miroungigenitalium TaxID=1042321 RepID=A0ABT3BNI7_9BACT|nr:16S rRNA (adenine(1518)-N(6)/adenine(1519)-N(6))-dimethyltransferase RsmA [Ureaplasma miroungigenitalium]MCV3728722.1 16S rRNA (adenine(1518)-N(6)/adenine(1519)-N(6))-dimethyltransferase RsmA [Ureaplasma miroungigenitalium]MCV3734486.1 16S rRNA (adenine(1518)-N(6)/adenine(1519)-N(6))-dimethyltransferase RsmA [Ureaplasma miroungigenitalium]
MADKNVKFKLQKESFVPSKKMGQNFLLSNQIKKQIVQAADISSEDLVIEIGPGLGAITEFLVQEAKFVQAIELDKRLFNHLTKNIKEANFSIINNDVLKVDFDALVAELKSKMQFNDVKVVANLPYSISSKIIEKLIKTTSIKYSYVMVQKEMADRVTAKVNTKDYNAFSVFVQLFANLKTLFHVHPKNFYPAPKVDSSVIMIENHDVCEHFDHGQMLTFLRLCFLNRRKKLLNNLLNKYDRNQIIQAFLAEQIDINARAQNLTQANFVNLFKILNKEMQNED